MARRSDHSREELYDLILNAAAELVEKKGFRALTARGVAEHIGYSAGTLYNLFENLDDLIVHLRGRTLDDLYRQAAGVEMTGDASADLSALVEVYLAYLDSHPNLWLSLFDHTLPDGKTLPGMVSGQGGEGLGSRGDGPVASVRVERRPGTGGSRTHAMGLSARHLVAGTER